MLVRANYCIHACFNKTFHMRTSVTFFFLLYNFNIFRGGELTLGRSNEQIASLIIALFPFFPSNPSDNRYHLQALRQLYAMAAEPRSLVAVDANTGMPVFIPLKITTTNQPVTKGSDRNAKDAWSIDPSSCECSELVAPCLLSMDLKRIVRVQINSDRFIESCVSFIFALYLVNHYSTTSISKD